MDEALKIAALFHDPPLKPYQIIAHEREAQSLIEQLFPGDDGSHIASLLQDRRIKDADKISTSTDRYPLLLLMGETWIRDFMRVSEVSIKNPIWPKIEARLPQTFRVEDYERFKRELSNSLGAMRGLRDKYLVLYLLFEYHFLRSGLPLGPADTRVPTYSILDHAYASVTALNAVDGGFLVRLDAGGIQRFISESRKLRDAWVSSYIVSALIWYTIQSTILELGPDTVILPSLRLNPFYAHLLRVKLEPKGGVRKALEDIEYGSFFGLSEEIVKLGRLLEMPPYPIIPGTATLLLPKDHRVDVEHLKRQFEEGWNKLWYAAKKVAEIRSESQCIWRFIHRVFRHYDERWRMSQFSSVPPLKLRVEVEALGKEVHPLMYDNAVRKLDEKIRRSKLVRKEQDVLVDLESLTASGTLGVPVPSRRGFEYCTMCGRLPAMVVMPAEEEGNLVSRFAGCDRVDEIFKVFSPGERLCPWCFLKRVLSLEPRILRVLLGEGEEIVEKIARSPLAQDMFPSTAHISLGAMYEEVNRELGGGGRRPDFWPLRGRLGEPVLGAAYEDPEDYESFEKYFEKIKKICDVGDEPGKFVWRYYALVRADVDRMGELLAGNPMALLLLADPSDWPLDELVAEFLVDSCKGPLRNLMNKLVDLALRGVEELPPAMVEDLSEIYRGFKLRKGVTPRDLINNAYSAVRQIIKAKRIPVTISFHTTISAALMRTAVMDIRAIGELGGFTVYAGGDDLLSFVPLHRALEASIVTRRNLAGDKGFHRIGNALLPALPGVGRSYSIAVAHYRFPLSYVVVRSHEELDRAKDEVLYGDGSMLRDIMAVFGIPGKQVVYLPISLQRLPTADPTSYFNGLASLLDASRDLLWSIPPLGDQYSHNLLYDLEALSELICEAEDEFPESSIKLVQKLLSSNFRGDGAGPLLDTFGSICGLGYVVGEACIPVSVFRATRVIRGGMH